jgi:type I restriction enzyme M protein
MNLALRGIEADFGPEHADTFRRDLHPDLRADTATRVSAKPKPRSHLAGLLRSERQLLANPPFNDSDWFRKDDDVRWQWSGATWTTEDCRQGERGGVHHSEARPGAAAIRSK